MAEIQGNITIIVFKDGTFNTSTNFTGLSVIQILTRVIASLCGHIEKQGIMFPTKSNVIQLPDKHGNQ